MTNGLTSPRAAERPPGPTPQAARGAPPQSDAFAGMLDAHQARTATAEGQSPEKPSTDPAPGQAKDRTSDVATPVVTDPAAEATPAPEDAATLAATVLAALVPVATAPVEGPAADTAVAVPTTAPVTTDPPAVAVSAAQVETTAAGVAAAATAAPKTAPAAVEAAPVVTEQTTTAKPATTSDAPATPVVDASAPVAKPSQTSDTPSGQDQPKPDAKAPVVATPAPAQQARVAAAYVPAERSHHTAAPVSPTAPTTATAAPVAQPALPAATPVPLSRAAENVEHVLRLASAQGVTHARIALKPADLGSVDVHIRSTSEGIVARVVAHSAESVQTLQHAANDLRRSLEEQGINVLNLDIGQSGDSSAGRAGTDPGAFGSGQQDGGASGSTGSDAPDETSTKTLRLPSGVLVDVLA